MRWMALISASCALWGAACGSANERPRTAAEAGCDDDDGSLRLRDAADQTLLRLRLKDDGYEVRDAAGATLAKARTRDGQVNFKTEEGADIGRLDGIESARAAMWLAAEPLTLEERAALVVYYLEIEH